jgi:L-2-amino-thiazoline-4-carboxylic acid hydrolase-like protein
MANLSLIEQRKIEANVLVPVIRAFESGFGKKNAHNIVQRVIEEIALKQGHDLAQQGAGTPMDTLDLLVPRFCDGGAMEMEVMHKSAEAYDFNVTRCRYAEFYHEMGVPDLGFVLSCSRDFALTKGISPKLELLRTKTIMQGDAFCDFRFRIKK